MCFMKVLALAICYIFVPENFPENNHVNKNNVLAIRYFTWKKYHWAIQINLYVFFFFSLRMIGITQFTSIGVSKIIRIKWHNFKFHSLRRASALISFNILLIKGQ